nr:immunoglobulin light chain junction region [Macaca mulatta]MPO06397.1 immunoglobulin light chain junction region [Macaca mulatta]MPO06778.1 immunoglobulin light chain junction region [Macaca mulatta]MPO09365.1 immunoglobulin light chain junction region [Macaca mulatta]
CGAWDSSLNTYIF